MRRLLGLSVLGLLLAIPASAHPEIYLPEPAGPKPIRVQSRLIDARRLVAGIGYVRIPDTLTFLREGASDSLAIPLDRIERLERAIGAHHLGGRYALIGAGLGLGLGVFAADRFGVGDVPFVAYATALGGAGALLGAGVGWLVGSSQHAVVWEPVDAAALRIGFDPRGRLEARLLARF